jgi:predicted nucleic acid-binding Zn finger protein
MIRVVEGIATVQSMEKRGVSYHVRYSSMLKRWICDCPDFRHRRMDSGEDCKHITKLLYYLETASMEQLEKMIHDN